MSGIWESQDPQSICSSCQLHFDYYWQVAGPCEETAPGGGVPICVRCFTGHLDRQDQQGFDFSCPGCNRDLSDNDMDQIEEDAHQELPAGAITGVDLDEEEEEIEHDIEDEHEHEHENSSGRADRLGVSTRKLLARARAARAR